MTYVGIGMVVFILFLLISGSRSNRRNEQFYASYFTQSQLDHLDRNPDGSKR